MTKIGILGNSLSCVRVIEEIRKYDAESEIVLIAPEGSLPYERGSLSEYLSGRRKEKDLFVGSESFFKKNHVEVIADKKITRVNLKRRQITTETKEHIDCDVLIVADTPEVKLPPVKGSHRNGIYNAARLDQIKTIHDKLPFIESIAVQITSFAGFQLACLLATLNKEVFAITPAKALLDQYVDEESCSIIKQMAEQKGMRIFSENHITEVLGDSDVKAVRLHSSKVLAAEMVIFDEVQCDLKAFGDNIPVLNLGENPYATNFEGVYALDAFQKSLMTPGTGNHYDIPGGVTEFQGRAIGALVAKHDMTEKQTHYPRLFQIGDYCGFLIGSTLMEEGSSEYMRFDPQKNIYKKFVAKDNVLTGALVINAFGELEKILRFANDRLDIAGVEDYILEENFSLDSILKMKAEQKSGS